MQLLWWRDWIHLSTWLCEVFLWACRSWWRTGLSTQILHQQSRWLHRTICYQWEKAWIRIDLWDYCLPFSLSWNSHDTFTTTRCWSPFIEKEAGYPSFSMIQIVLLNIESSRIAIKMYANVDFVLLFLDIHDIMYSIDSTFLFGVSLLTDQVYINQGVTKCALATTSYGNCWSIKEWTGRI